MLWAMLLDVHCAILAFINSRHILLPRFYDMVSYTTLEFFTCGRGCWGFIHNMLDPFLFTCCSLCVLFDIAAGSMGAIILFLLLF